MPEQHCARQIVKTADRIGRLVEAVSGGFCVCCFAAMTLVAILGVFFRYVMQSPFMWTEEVARYLLVWLGFTAISIALRRDRHIKVEILASIAPPVIVKPVGYLVDVLIAVFFVVFLWQGYLMTVNNIMTASTINISMTWIYAALPLAAGLALLQHFLNIIKKIFMECAPDPVKEQEKTGGDVS